MTRGRAWWGLLGLLAATALAAPGAAAPTAPETAAEVAEPNARVVVRHITLTGTKPEADKTVAGEVKEVRLFFSGAPLLRGASVRIVNASRSLVRSTPPVADPNDPKQLFVQIEPALAPGVYVVQWRCIADDGHVMRGDFRFEVKAG